MGVGGGSQWWWDFSGDKRAGGQVLEGGGGLNKFGGGRGKKLPHILGLELLSFNELKRSFV